MDYVSELNPNPCALYNSGLKNDTERWLTIYRKLEGASDKDR